MRERPGSSTRCSMPAPARWCSSKSSSSARSVRASRRCPIGGIDARSDLSRARRTAPMAHRWISTLVCVALLGISSTAAAQEPVSPDRQVIEQIIHDYLMAHPEVVVEALKANDAKAKAREEA